MFRRLFIVPGVLVLLGPNVMAEPMPTVAEQEIGARLGTRFAVGSVTPGGVQVGGVFLQRMAERSWFDGAASFTFGADDSACTLDGAAGSGSLTCSHGIVDGFGFQLALGGRWRLRQRRGGLEPYVRAGLALEVAYFGEDQLTGAALPLWGGLGGRFRVADGVAVGGELLLFGGPAVYDRGLGTGWTTAGMIVQAGVDFAL